MKAYKYTARNLDGELIKGVVYGSRKDECFNQLRSNKLYPIKLRSVYWAKEGLFNLSKSIKYAEMGIFCKQFSALLRAGISIPQALRLLDTQKGSPLLQKIIIDLINGLEQGLSLHQVVCTYEKNLPGFFSSLVKAGEMTNSLELVLEDLSNYYFQIDQFRRQIRQLLVYPCILLFSTIGVICFLFVKIIPGFNQIYANFDAEMPVLTNCLLAMSHYLNKNLKIYLIGFSICMFSLPYFFKKMVHKKWFVSIQYSIPLWGDLKKKFLTARLARTLSLLLENGLEVLQSIELVRGSVGILVDSLLIDVISSLKQGNSLAVSLKRTKFFPKIFLEMTSVGEEAGALGKMLAKTAELYEKESKEQIEKLVSLFEPVLLMIISILVGIIVLAIMTPMFDLIKVL